MRILPVLAPATLTDAGTASTGETILFGVVALITVVCGLGLLAAKRAVSAPHPMVEGTEDGDYYRGKVVGSTQAQIDWVRSHRPEDPSLGAARAKAAPTASGRGSRHTVKGAL